jgi:hypothetical protein
MKTPTFNEEEDDKYENQTKYKNDKIIYITPISQICNPVKRLHKRKDGLCTQITYYKSFKEQLLFSKLSANDEEVTEELKKALKLCYKMGEIIKLPISQITTFIQNKFRYVEPFVHYEKQEVSIPPYILGVWLGDGNSGNIGLTNIDTSIINEWKQYAFNEKLKIRVNEQNIRKTDIQAYEENVTCCY